MSGDDFDSRVGDRSKRLKLGSGLFSKNDVIPNNVAKYLGFNIKGKVDKIGDCITKLMLDDKDSQRIGVIELYDLVSQDPRINESDHLTSEAVRRLIEFLSPNDEDKDHWGFPYYAALILGYAKNWGDVPKKDAVLPLKELISFKDEQLLGVGLHALALVACDFSTHQAILDCDMLESVAEIFHGNKAKSYRIARHCAKFLSAFCSNALSQEKKDACIGIIKNLFRCWESEEVMVPACYALFNLTKGINVALENCVVEKLVFLTSLPDPYLIFPALEVLGNIVRWGDKQLIKVMIDNNVVLRLEGFLKSKNKIVQKEACWIISNIFAKSSKEIEVGSKLNRQESSIFKLIECLCFILKNDDESDVQMEAAWAIFNWFIDDSDFKEIKWPRRGGEAFSIIRAPYRLIDE